MQKDGSLSVYLEQPKDRHRRILAIDGGGVRCMVALEILLALENRIIELTGDPSAG